MLATIAAWYALLSIIAFAAYAWDKRAAVRNGWRTRERTLLLLDALGGWPGGMAAQRLLRHKRRKASYMLRFRLIVTLHVLAWGALLWLWMR